MEATTMIATPTEVRTPDAGLTVMKSPTPSVYVPRRFRIAGLQGIRQGAAIVGTPQGHGTVAIDVEGTPYVDPTPEVWSLWVTEAARKHRATEEELAPGEEMQTVFVAEHDLVKVGRYENGRVISTDEVAAARLNLWLESGRAAHTSLLAAD